MNVGEKRNENVKITIPSTDYDGSKQLDKVEYFKYLGSLITHDARKTRENNSILHIKSSYDKKPFFTRTVYLNLMKKQVKCYNWTITLYDAKTWTLQKAWRCGARKVWRRSAGTMG